MTNNQVTNHDLERQVKELESKEIFNSDQIKIIRFLLREDFQPWSGRLRQFLIKIRPLLDDPIFVEAFKKSEIRRTLFEDIKVKLRLEILLWPLVPMMGLRLQWLLRT